MPRKFKRYPSFQITKGEKAPKGDTGVKKHARGGHINPQTKEAFLNTLWGVDLYLKGRVREGGKRPAFYRMGSVQGREKLRVKEKK